jgi:Amt family ammonium transporter
MGSALDVLAISIVVVNTNIAACAGVVVAIILSQLMFKKIDLTIALNGAIAGLVAITAGPDLQNHFLSIIVGGIGGALSTFAIPLMDKLKIDDVVGAIPAHLVAGIWGTLAVGIFGAGSIGVQIIGILAAAVLVVPLSAILFFILKGTVGLRMSVEEEAIGMDKAELTTEAYPEFR